SPSVVSLVPHPRVPHRDAGEVVEVHGDRVVLDPAEGPELHELPAPVDLGGPLLVVEDPGQLPGLRPLGAAVHRRPHGQHLDGFHLSQPPLSLVLSSSPMIVPSEAPPRLRRPPATSSQSAGMVTG